MQAQKIRYKAVIFDLDGVLVHTDEYHYLAWKQLCDLRKIPFDRTVNDLLRGVSRRESLEIILSRAHSNLSETDKESFLAEKNAVYRKFLEQMTPEDVGPEVRSTLRTLRERGKKLAVGSSSKNTKFILAQVGLEKFFDAVSDGTNITRTKPDPEVFLEAAQMLGVETGCCLVVEDAVSGVLAAEAAHMDCAAMGDAARHHRATYDIEHLSALKDIVL